MFFEIELVDDGHRRAMLKNISLSLMLTLSLFTFPVSVQATDAGDTLQKVLLKDKIFPSTCVLSVQLIDRQAILRVGNYQPTSDETMRVDSVLAAKKVIDAYPQVSCVVIRCAWNPVSFTDVFVTAKQMISYGAGTIEKAELLASLTCVKLSTGDSPQFVFNRYFVEGEQALAKNDNGKAELLFNMAFQEAPAWTAAASDSKVMNNYLELARNFQSRDDYGGAARVLMRVMSVREAAGLHATDGDTAKVVMALAEAYIMDKREPQAIEVLTKAIDDGKSSPVASSVVYAQMLEKLASCLQPGSTREQELLREALKVRESQPGAEDIALVAALERLADSMTRTTRSSDAIELYKRAISALDKAMITKDYNKRISYEVYSTSVNRMHQKLAQLGHTAGHSNSNRPHW